MVQHHHYQSLQLYTAPIQFFPPTSSNFPKDLLVVKGNLYELGKCSLKNCTREFLVLQTFILCTGNSVHHELLSTVLPEYLSLSFETYVVAMLAHRSLRTLEMFNSKMVPHTSPFIVLWLRILRALEVD